MLSNFTLDLLRYLQCLDFKLIQEVGNGAGCQTGAGLCLVFFLGQLFELQTSSVKLLHSIALLFMRLSQSGAVSFLY